MSSGQSGDDRRRQVQEILEKAAIGNDRPTDAQLGPVYKFLIPSASSSSPSSSHRHWYCSKTTSDLHREAATFLIFLFAFKREGTSKLWMDALEDVLRTCEVCSRQFGAARRRFAKKYMANYPDAVRSNFFAAVNRWQAQFILDEIYSRPKSTENGEISSESLALLPRSIMQLLLGEPALIDNETIRELVTTNSKLAPEQSPAMSYLGLSPMLVRLRTSTLPAMRDYADKLLRACRKSPISLGDYLELGVGDELEKVYKGQTGLSEVDRWSSVLVILKSGCLSHEAIRQGVLRSSNSGKRSNSILHTIKLLLLEEGEAFPLVLETLATLLHARPTPDIWQGKIPFDEVTSFFTNIADSETFRSLLARDFESNGESDRHIDHKGKMKLDGRYKFDPLSWIRDMLNSLLPVEGSVESASNPNSLHLAFASALNKSMAFLLRDLQAVKYSVQMRGATAKEAFSILLDLESDLFRREEELRTAFSDTLDQHAPLISSMALRHGEYSASAWGDACDAARSLTLRCTQDDSRDLQECFLGLSTVILNEKRRRHLAKKAQAKGEPVPTATKVKSLQRASVRKSIWNALYDSNEAARIPLLMRAVAESAHIEKLTRYKTWSYERLGLEEVVSQDLLAMAKRAINLSIKASRDNFQRTMESAAITLSANDLAAMWKQDSVAQASIMLLLSPDEDVHDAMISLVQQAFADVDDRGDCFRALLTKYPLPAMEGLIRFLEKFIQTAPITPESCSLSKWLVRCFTDILDVLCQSTGFAPLLQSRSFLGPDTDGSSMVTKVTQLWDHMCTALSIIFKRTPEWAPLYDSATMVDWMRDALIFGRQIANNFRSFEGAASGTMTGLVNGKSPAKASDKGIRLLSRLEPVLKDLTSWLRLTDAETLHQAFELIRTIVNRMAQIKPDVSKAPILEEALLQLDRYSRKDGKAYQTRLSDSDLSELADFLIPFNLVFPVDDEDASVPMRSSLSSSSKTVSSAQNVTTEPKNAFETMMRSASKGGDGRTTTVTRPPTKAVTPEVVTIDDSDNEYDDGFFNDITAYDLDGLELGAASNANKSSKATAIPPRPPTTLPSARQRTQQPKTATGPPPKPQPPTARPASSQKLNMRVGPSIIPAKKPPGSSFKTQMMRDLRRDHQAELAERKRFIGGVVPKVPTASSLGTGLGAFTGKRSKPEPPERVHRSDTSSSETTSDSDRDGGGVSALVAKQKRSPQKTTRLLPERRPLREITGRTGVQISDYSDHRERQRAEQHAMRQRLKPDLTGLYRYALAWNPDHQGSEAPHPPQMQKELRPLSTVKTQFTGSDEYQSIMTPLFLQELWSQFSQEKSAGIPLQVLVSMRSYEDEFIDVELIVQGRIPDNFYANESDLVILRRPACQPIIAKVQDFKRRARDVILKVRILALVDQKQLTSSMAWQLNKHMSLSTALREYAALRGLPYYNQTILRDTLDAHSATMPRLSEETVVAAQKAYDLNEPQARAILGALSVKGFALIQGPPGTGKTKTISGLIGKFMSERKASIPLNGERAKKPKLLVCAPSNAAIDEVCKRLIDGVPSANGDRLRPVVVRIGIDSSVNMAVKDVSLESLVEARVSATASSNGGGSEYSRIQAELESIKTLIREKQDQIREAQGEDAKRRALETECHALMTKRTQLGHQSSKAKDAARDATRHLEGARRAARDAILSEADIVCSTLSGAGHDSLTQYTFETVIIDESAQAIELSCLIPLRYGCQRCIMVGDPNQLPPTTICQDMERYHYNESLFVRMTRRSSTNVQLLSIQYRMHPFISELPSKVFYHGQLKDGPKMAEKTAAIWHSRQVYGPYRFFNVQGTETKSGTSTLNSAEAAVAVNLYRGLENEFGSKVNLTLRIGVITMYREQLWEMKRKFTEAFGAEILEKIEFNTVDGFQGQEKDIIILSCVRSGSHLQTIGFLKDPRRMNVALTRAKSSLFIIGNGETLERTDNRWRTIVTDARDRGFFIDYTPTTFAPSSQSVEKKPKRRASDMSLDSNQEPGPAKKGQRKSKDKHEKPKTAIKTSPEAVVERKPTLPEISPVKRKTSVSGPAPSAHRPPTQIAPQVKRENSASSSKAKANGSVDISMPPPKLENKPNPIVSSVKRPLPPSAPPPAPKPPKQPKDSMFMTSKKRKPRP